MFFSLLQLEALNTIQVSLPVAVLKHMYFHMPNTLQKAGPGVQGWAESDEKHLLKPVRTEGPHIRDIYVRI